MKILVANRGEIACRVFHTLRESEIESVAVCTEVDQQSPHVWLADHVVNIGEPRAYLDMNLIIDAAKQTGATAIHPGYGFLAENAGFAKRCAEEGLVFLGPSSQSIEAFADKRAARALAEKHGVPVIPGAEACDSIDDARGLAQEVGYPVLLKAAAGGGGKGMRRVNAEDELAEAFESASREAESSFNDGRLLLESYIHPARHIEVQILGDGKDAMGIGLRECSLQRRYQKVIEESPAASIGDETCAAILRSALTLIKAVGYLGAGTVEFLVGPDGAHYFLEVNTRLQVEHPVTELVTGVDLVAQQISLAHGGTLPAEPAIRGHAIEARLNAEDAYAGFIPQTGRVQMLRWPQSPHVRVDTGIEEGSVISPHYDSMLAKVIAWGPDRETARKRLVRALRDTILLGVVTNQSFLIDILENEFFSKGDTFTTTVESSEWSRPEMPDHAQSVAEGVTTQPLKRSVAAGQQGDAFSPWQHLGSFRMGR